MKIKLIGEGFVNCNLKTVRSAFSNSAIFGIIPYRLFYMNRNNKIHRSIEDMAGVFKGCYYLGYDEEREIDLITEIGIGDNKRKLTWNNHIVSKLGNEVYYKLDMSNLSKITHDNGSIDFDDWYLDGFGYKDANSTEDGLDEFKENIIKDYINYDIQQEKVIKDQLELERYISTYQNYMIPTDLFRYCNNKCTLENVLKDLNWNQNIIEEDLQTGELIILRTEKLEGMKGRIPPKLFDSLVDSTEFINVFSETNFTPYLGLSGSDFKRGLMFPPKMLHNNIELTSISGMFSNIEIPVGVDINSDLLENNINLRIISSLFSNCKFDNRDYNNDNLPENQLKNSQINFRELCKTNIRIINASNMFAVNKYENGLGLLLIESTLLDRSFNMNNIGSMFSGNILMKGSVPEFKASVYPVITVFNSYLAGVPKTNITNAGSLEPRLIPEEWITE